MRETERIDRIMDKLSELWHKHPEQRFGQVLENYVFGYLVPSPLFYVADDTIEERMDTQLDVPIKNQTNIKSK